MELYGSLIANEGSGGGGGGTADVPIKSISVNGQGVVPVNKNVNIDVPTKTSDLTNDSNFASTNDIPTKTSQLENDSNFASTAAIPTKTSQLTNDSSFVTESDLTAKNYADKTYVGEQIAQSEHLKREIVTVLPEPTVADEHTIYMIKDDSVQGNDKYKEYMLIQGVVQCVGDTSVDLTDYVKTAELPTELPANGGNSNTVNNHTVESNVPVGAKFTDTVYDDTNIKYGEIAGGKNLFNGNFIEEVLAEGKNYTDVKLIKEQNSIKDIKGITFAVFGAYLKSGTYTFSYTNNAYFSLNRVAIAGTDCVLAIESIRKSYTWTQNADGWTYFGIEGDDSETGVTDTQFSITPDIQIEEGDTATPYEPYIPSVKMLADEVSEQNKSLSDLENAINGLNDDNYWEQGTWNILGQKVDEPTIIRMKEKLILPIDYSVSLVNSNYVYEVDYYENGEYKNDTDWISGSIVIPNGQEFVLLIRKVDNSSLVPTERNAISVLPKNIGTINDKLKNDLGGLSFSASGTTLSITDGKNTWTLEANK